MDKDFKEVKDVNEVKEQTKEVKDVNEKKPSFLKKSWTYIVTGVTCAVVSGGIVAGADVAKVQETLNKAQAQQVAIQAAAYGIEQVVNELKVKDGETKKEAVVNAINKVKEEIPTIINGVNNVKETVVDIKENVDTIKEGIKKEESKEKETVKEEAKKTEEKKTEEKK